MMRRFVILLLFLSSTFMIFGEVKQLSKKDFLEKVYNYEKNPTEWKFQSSRPCVIDFYATWCGPCKMLAPVFQEVGNEFENKANFYKIDIDESLDIARQFSVSTVPTVIIFKNGEPVERLVGFMPKEHLASKIKEHI